MSGHESFFATTLQAFGAIGLPVTLFSSAAACVRWVQRASAERMSASINIGIAFGFLPGSCLAFVVFVRGVWL